MARCASAVLAVAGVAVLASGGLTLAWGEPFTAVTAARAQTALRQELAREEAAPATSVATFRRGLRQGQAIGRIVVPRIGLRTVFVEGTAPRDLARGPGHYRITGLPGTGGTVAIAGHRTTYLQPFRHLDRLRPGDAVVLELPYGTFRYVVYGRRIVDDQDWSILRRRQFEKLVLTACHPLHSASQRIVVFARLRADLPPA